MSTIKGSNSEDKRGLLSQDVEKCEVTEPLLQRRFLTPLLSKQVPPIPTEDERKLYPDLKKNPVSTLFFGWLNPLLRVGYKRTLVPNDLYRLDGSLSIEHTYEAFKENLMKVLHKDNSSNVDNNHELVYSKNSIVKALMMTLKWEYSLAITLKLLSDISQVVVSILSKSLINFVSEKTLFPNTPVKRGVGYAFGVTLLLITSNLLLNHFLYLSLVAGAKVKAILTTLILDKTFRADAHSRHTFTNGKVTSIMSTDLARIDQAVGLQPYAITAPVPLAIAIALLIVNIGPSSLAGVGVFLLSLVIIITISTLLIKMRARANRYTDSRISYMREILQNIKVIKLYSWEDAYERIVTGERNNEMGIILKMQSIRNFLAAFAISLPSLVSMVAFLVMYGVSKDKNPANIFPSLYLFSILGDQLLMMPTALSSAADAKVGLERLRLYLQSTEIEDEKVDGEADLPPNISMEVNNGFFVWEKFQDADNGGHVVSQPASITNDVASRCDFNGFDNLNLSIPKGSFVVITGPIGSGKSSLLLALAGFMKRTSGSVSSNGSLLLCGQPWIQNTTLRENILFGAEYDEVRYRDVIRVCALEDDLKMFTAGDLTEVGERGITLSGGQKARINLARGIYADNDIILLDDILSAVDARVGKFIVDECLNKYLKDKTVLLATHQLSLVNLADALIYLNEDGTVSMGTFEELSATCNGFNRLLEYYSKKEDVSSKESSSKKEPSSNSSGSGYGGLTGDGILIEEEEKGVNSIAWSVYKSYLHEGQGVAGPFALPVIGVVMSLNTFALIFVNVWLSFWVSDKFREYSNGFYIGIYVALVIASVLCTAIGFLVLGYFFSTASRKLYIKALKRILHTPMCYLDVTPMGRIMNRFTKDTDDLDNGIGKQLVILIYTGSFVIGVLVLCIVYLPWFALTLPPTLLACFITANFYIASSIEVKRIESIQRSHVFNNFHEILNGLNTLKAYHALGRFMAKNKRLLNRMNEAYLVVIANQRWISIHLELISCLLVFVISMLSVNKVFEISASSVGLIVTYVMHLASLMSSTMRAYTSVENEMNSVERLCFYANDLEQEQPYRINETRPRPSWPEHGAIEFQNVSMRYRYGSPLVLRNLSISVKGGEKIGICGRTGAGKSSIMNVLFRLTEPAEGAVIIDGVDTSKLGLYDLRSKLSIIPQDPVLFRGTIRKNLDPFEQSEDSALWEALRKAGLIDTEVLRKAKSQHPDDPNRHKFHLDQLVEDDGSNFSNGERQLIALARALVRDSKILVLDEATSSVDYETDAKIQNTIAKEFSECTILCIAHRLNTILNYDRILVLEKGKVEQFDTPWALFSQDGIFRQMCERSGINSTDLRASQ